eukprot:CAMPEP_0182425168 /NCGR_PEP_ID=MMETSP1167-20130531/11522_1 /TAXON_ID=2988 /ORGANISM="Mallomonas Sp, Strain CCMP3275" /LENGTH=409 /DNA_ID=CAMNT_0024605607 /DNA_START=80 /DNA_END=1309 /DNA_ORIENTATION=-
MSKKSIDEMRLLIQALMRRILDGESLRSDGSPIQGTLQLLNDKGAFLEMIYPGTSLETLQTLPQNLRQLLQWEFVQTSMRSAIPRMSENSAQILSGVKTKGRDRGDIMDEMTEKVISQQIVEETFAREIVKIVRTMGERANIIHARLTLNEADRATSTDSRILDDQLDDDVLQRLVTDNYAVQDEFLGTDWCDLIQKDMERFIQIESMTPLERLRNPVLPPTPIGIKATGNSLEKEACMSWVEAETVRAQYPALAEAIDSLHRLPYELNARMNEDEGTSFHLLQPAPGATQLVYYPIGSCQPYFQSDSNAGIRVSSAYHILNNADTLTHEGDVSQSLDKTSNTDINSSIIYSNILLRKIQKSNIIEIENKNIEVKSDRLLLYTSSEYACARSEVIQNTYFALVFYIHGK